MTMRSRLRTWWVPTGEHCLKALEAIGAVAGISSVVAAAYAIGGGWFAGGIIALVGLLVCGVLWRTIVALREALGVRFTWGEAERFGAAWGWHRNRPGEIQGPYCANGHGRRLRLRSTGALVADGDVLGPGTPLYCDDPQHASENIYLEGTLRPESVGQMKARLRTALTILGVWRRLSA